MSRFNPIKTVYKDMNYFENNHWWYMALQEFLLKWIKKYNPKIILDAGCGTGTNMLILKNNSFKVFGFDISEEALDFCQKKGLENIKKGQLGVNVFNQKFNLIYCFDVLGNIEKNQLNRVFDSFYNSLEENGILLINTSSIPWIYSNHDKAWDIKNRYYLHELEEFLKKSNFKIVYSTYRVFLLFPVVLISRFLEKIIIKNPEKIRGDIHKTNKIINFIFFEIMKFENFLLNHFKLPIGSSVFIVAEKTIKTSF